VTLLVISPDYASHATPLLAIAGAWAKRGERVVVATGRSVEPLVRSAGYEHEELRMSRGSNAGIAAQASSRAERHEFGDFIAATRRGMLATLRYQAQTRSADLLWQPDDVARRTMDIVERVRPDTILVDHVAIAASLGLRALGVPYGDVVLGHPTALPVGDEVYGVPNAWPVALAADVVELAELHTLARSMTERLARTCDAVLRSLSPASGPVGDPFAAHGDMTLFLYPEELHPGPRTARLPEHAFLGSAVRLETPDDQAAAWLAGADGRPIVVVSFGTFLSARDDVLARVTSVLQRMDVRVALAVGATPRAAFGALPDDWLVRPSLPQVALLREAHLLISHAGNNSVTEALTHGVPLLVMPFSTDQFDGAAAIERHVAGIALDAHGSSRPLIAGSVRGLLGSPPQAPRRIAARLREEPGPELAYAAMARLARKAERRGMDAPQQRELGVAAGAGAGRSD
jgi:UDP:flavonoid glycosyltransferase YjiC (YdhE family)